MSVLLHIARIDGSVSQSQITILIHFRKVIQETHECLYNIVSVSGNRGLTKTYYKHSNAI